MSQSQNLTRSQVHFAAPKSAAMRCAGFSLVEITIAIGVVAFAFVSLLGLLPTGLTTFREAMDTSVGAQIAQRIAGELQETDYATLLKACKPDLSHYLDSDNQSGHLPRRYFDDQGNEVKVANSDSVSQTERVRILYEVLVRVSRKRMIPVEGDRAGSKNLAAVVIQVANNPAGFALPLTPEGLIDTHAAPVSVHSYPVLVARNSMEPELAAP